MKLNIMTKLIGMVAFVVITACLSIYFTSHYFMNVGFDDQAKRTIVNLRGVVDKTISDSMASSLMAARFIGEKPEFAVAVASGDQARVRQLAVKLMKDAHADFMTVSDAGAKVVARGHSDKFGDDISNQATAMKALKGESSVGIIAGTVVPFSIRASSPLILDGRIVGSVSLGASLAEPGFIDGLKSLTGVEVTIFKGDTRMMTTLIKADGTRAIGTRMDNQSILDTVLKQGGTFLSKNNIFDKEYQTAYWPVRDIDGNVAGMWFIGMPMSSVKAAINKVEESTLIVSLVIMLVMLVAATIFARSLAKPIIRTTEYASQVAAGNLDEHLDVRSNDEVGKLAAALEVMVGNLKGKIQESQEQTLKAAEETEKARAATVAADEARREAVNARREGMLQAAEQLGSIVDIVSSASEELSAQIEQAARGAELQSQRASETATAMEQMNATVLEVARSAAQAASTSDGSRGKADSGSVIVQEVVGGIGSVQKRSEVLQQGMNDLGKRAAEIGRIMNVISDIADQTNLLALNAAIEAARAGDAGRGFAVVADEVRKLAEKTMSATKEVGDAIAGIQKGTQANVTHVAETVREIVAATERAREAGVALREIVTLAETASDQVRSIAAASEEQSSASEEINRAVDEVNRIASETSDAMSQSARAVMELAEQTQKMQQVIAAMQKA